MEASLTISTRYGLYKGLLFTVGLVYYFSYSFVGTLRGGETILFIFALLIPSSIFIFLRYQINRWLLGFIGINLCLIVLSNHLNGVSVVSSMKGMSNTLFIITSMIGTFALLYKDPILIRYLFLGLFLGSFFFSPYIIDLSHDAAGDQFFDLIVVPRVYPLLLLAATFHQRFKLLFFILCFGFGVAALIANARSTGLIIVLSSLIYGITIFVRKRFAVSIYIASLSLLVVSIIVGYNAFARSGKLGEIAQTQIKEGKSALSLLLVIGRPDPLIALVAIKDRPWLGHGSENNGQRYIRRTVGVKLLPNKYQDFFGMEKMRIPSHSVILGAAVESGVLSILPWLLVLLYGIYVLLHIQDVKHHPLYFIVIFTCFSIFWNIPFSPFGYARYDFPYLWASTLLTTHASSPNMRFHHRSEASSLF